MSYPEQDYDKFELDADDICYCEHRRDCHDYSPTDKVYHDTKCSKCECTSWNMSDYSEFILPYKRLYWKLFKGYKTPKIVSISKKLKEPTQEEVDEIIRRYCK